MGKTFGRLIFAVASAINIFGIFRFIFRHKVTIIVYHNPNQANFRLHLSYLTKHYNLISLSDYVNSLTQSESHLPDNSLIITVDDGHKNNYCLLPVIKEYNVPVTIYLTSEVIGTKRRFWWTVPGNLGEVDMLKKMSNNQKNQYLFEKYGYSLTDEFENERYALSYDEIQLMKEYVDFQCHTSFHPILTKCTEEELVEELINSKNHLEKILDKDIHHLSYPNGSHNDAVVSVVKSSGYLSARTTKLGLNGIKTDPYKLKIIGVSDKANPQRLELDMIGLPLFFINLFRRLKLL